LGLYVFRFGHHYAAYILFLTETALGPVYDKQNARYSKTAPIYARYSKTAPIYARFHKNPPFSHHFHKNSHLAS